MLCVVNMMVDENVWSFGRRVWQGCGFYRTQPREDDGILPSECDSQTVHPSFTICFTMESLLRNLKERVTCSICLDTYTEPKTITCLHTFCCECLKRHALTTQREGKFRCPECQAQVGVPERFDQLPTGFLQNSLLGLLAVQQSGDGSEISCGSCRKKSAETSFCSIAESSCALTA